MRRRRDRRLSVTCAQGCLLHGVEVSLLQLRHAGYGEIEVVGPCALHTNGRTLRGSQRWKQRSDDGVRRRSSSAEVGWASVRHMAGSRVAAHLRCVHKDLVGMVGGRVVLGQAMVRVLGLMVMVWRLVKGRRPLVMERTPVLRVRERIIAVRRMAVVARMRVLW